MLESTKKYLYERRRGLAKTVGFAGGLYVLTQYVTERIEEFRERRWQQQAASDNLRRRFEQNQEDISFTTMTLVPTLGKHVLKEMDVETLTHELQLRSKASKGKHIPVSPISPDSALGSSVQLVQEQDAHSDLGSASIISLPENGGESSLGESSSSWVEEFASQSLQPPPLPRQSSASSVPQTGSVSSESNSGIHLTESMITTSSVPSSNNGESSASGLSDSQGSEPSNTRTKAELWKEVKMLTVTRTLTVLYSVTLLSLFTQIQLTILGRHKYIHSVMQQERDERSREKLLEQVSISSLFWEPPDTDLDLEEELDSVSKETEMKYLTLSWWILHVGWKDVGERVKRGVEEVFEGVSLKSKLGSMELHRLIGDVRRRVEHEITFEGTERRINFLSTLIPPTPETLQHVLLRGGIAPYALSLSNPYPHSDPDPVFTSLLAETRSILSSSDFSFVLEACLDRSTDVLFDGLKKNVFSDSTEEGEDVRVRLAGMLPGLSRWSNLALTALPNELVDALLGLREVTAFSAIIFSKFEDRFR